MSSMWQQKGIKKKKELTKQEGDKTKHAAVLGFQASCRFLKDCFYLPNSSKNL